MISNKVFGNDGIFDYKIVIGNDFEDEMYNCIKNNENGIETDNFITNRSFFDTAPNHK